MFDKLRAKIESSKAQPLDQPQKNSLGINPATSATPMQQPVSSNQAQPQTTQDTVSQPSEATVAHTEPTPSTPVAATTTSTISTPSSMSAARPPMSPEARMAAAATAQQSPSSAQPAASTTSAVTAEQQESAPSGEITPVKGTNLHSVNFADIWFTPENIAYIRDVSTSFALRPIETNDLEDFKRALEQSFQGISSYAVQFGGDTYRVERVKTSDGIQYNCRKMPTECPEIETLGFAPAVVKHLTSLSRAAGLLLFAGPTGQGKTTTVSALMKRYLNTDGGFLYTIEDPPEMPLRGLYRAKNGGLGLCKQTPVENDQWGAGLRSALRSKPRYILVGEIRTPETASQCLVAATSGHLVLSTIHASGVEDALNSMIKYAASTGLDNSLVADLLARGILGVVHQRLEGTTQLKLIYQYAFANPNPNSADQMRMTIRDGNINLATFMEQQHTKMDRGLPLFRD